MIPAWDVDLNDAWPDGRHCQKGERYPPDLTDEEWACIQPFLPGETKTGRPIETDLREVLTAIRFSSLLLAADIDASAVGQENLDDAQIANSLARCAGVFGGIGRKRQDRIFSTACTRIGVKGEDKLPALGCGK